MTDDPSLGAITDESYDDNYYNDSYDDEYLGDGEEIDDFDEDLPDEMHLPHVFNCLQSMTKKVTKQKPATRSKGVNGDNETFLVLEKLLTNSDSDLSVLTDLVERFVAREQLGDDPVHRAKQLESIYKLVMNVYPKKSFYHLITRWSRKKKQDFIKDSLNTVLVLNSHCGDIEFDRFLDRCREITIIPPVNNRRKYLCMTMNTNKKYRPVRNASTLVTQLDMTMQLMYKGISSITDITLSGIRMDKVSKKQLFTLPSPTKPVPETDSDDAIGCVKDRDSGIQIQTNALTGVHLLSSFRKRIWLYFDTVKLTKLLFDFILGKTIKEKMYLGKKKYQKVMQFFYNCIGGQATRRMYMSVLVDICLVFQTLEDIN